MSLPADILFAGELSTSEAVQLVQDFESVGLTAELREIPPRRAAADIAWLAIVAVPLTPFFEELARNFAADAYKRLNSWASKILGRRRPQASEPPRVVLLQDSATGIQVVIEADLPAEAYRQLMSFDLSVIRSGPVHYDRHGRRWRSELDEAKPSKPPRA